MRFATKVKSLFKMDESEASEEYKEATFKDAAIHDQAKAELHVSDDLANEVDSDGEPIPEMLKLDSQTSEENNFEESEETKGGGGASAATEGESSSNVKGSATVAFLGRNAVVRDYRKSEQADAFDETESPPQTHEHAVENTDETVE